MTAHALRLTTADFDAFRIDRISTTAARRSDLGERVLAFAKWASSRLGSVGRTLELASSPHRSVAGGKRRVDGHWVAWFRDRATREHIEATFPSKEVRRSSAVPLFRRHPFLALRIDAQHVEVCLELDREAEGDVARLGDRLANPARAAELIAAIASLPEGFAVGASTGGRRVACADVGAELVERMLEASGARDHGLWIGRSFGREIAIGHGDALGAALVEALVALAPVYALVTSTPLAPEAAPPRLERGAKVRVLTGPFAGKLGVVTELDGRGFARVALGLLSVHLEAANLAPARDTARRPPLESSHRRRTTESRTALGVAHRPVLGARGKRTKVERHD